jgi:hypothetical protein
MRLQLEWAGVLMRRIVLLNVPGNCSGVAMVAGVGVGIKPGSVYWIRIER